MLQMNTDMITPTVNLAYSLRMTVGHVMSDPRTTQIEYMFSSLVSVFSHIVYVWLDRLLAVRSTLLADINQGTEG